VLPGKALLLLRDRTPDRRDTLVWRWRGQATKLADFGDPRSRTGYRLCVYEPRRTGTRLVLDARAPAGGRCSGRRCWRKFGRAGFVYRDPQATPDGVRRIVLHPGPAGEAAIVVAARGGRLGVPRLPLTPKVTVQLLAGNDTCFEASYSAPLANAGTRFRARAD
jgi:hypothetical protein